MNRLTMSIAIRHGLRLPVPIPNACAALRDVCFKVIENEEKLSPYDEKSTRVTGVSVLHWEQEQEGHTPSRPI